MPLAPPVIKIVLLLSFIIKYPSKLWDHRQSCEEALRRSTQTQRPPDARGDRASGRRTPSSRARDTRARMHGETARQGGVRRPAVPEIRGTIGKIVLDLPA